MTGKSSKNREEIILVLQGGCTLGAYQAGAYEALSENGFAPQWIAGISIGAINGAIIAGNRPENRVKQLRTFWERVSSGLQGISLTGDGHHRTSFNEASALLSFAFGVPGFFAPRFPPPVFASRGGTEALSYYSTEPLIRTLSELVDFDYLNREGPRLSVGAVNIRTGNLAFFDKAARRHELRCALKRLLRKLPEELRDDPDALRLARVEDEPSVTIVHLIYRERAYETHARDYEFSRVSVEEHWAQGRKDVLITLAHDNWKNREPKEGITVLDLTKKSQGVPA